MGAHFAYGIKNPLPIKKGSTLGSYAQGKNKWLPVGFRIEDNPVPGVGIKCADGNVIERICLSFSQR
jgi:hypothetical protein